MFNTVWKAINYFFTTDFPIESPHHSNQSSTPYQWVEEDWLDEMSVDLIASTYKTTPSHIVYMLTNLGYDVNSNYPREITLPRDRSKYPILSCC